ncbi:hypothetical protein [Nostoc sp.]|uniref:hypothetical protein n=1 Tax=Nostoc sp. TaxID=1180 RepID=UPI002FF1F21D
MIQSEKNFCFCTLALGKKYIALACLLAKDIEIHSPNTYLIVLTDDPEEFSRYSQVLAFKHQQQGVKCYHDKRFAIAKSLSLFNSCIFIDSDMRILASVPEDMQWLLTPGISARACMDMPKKFAKVLAGTANSKLVREFAVVQDATKMLNLEASWKDINFVHEYLFSVTKDSGKEIEFLNQWEVLANYFELNGIYEGEGNAIGLAAYKAGLTVRWSEMEGISFFNNKIEIVKINKGQSNRDEISKYFEEHDKILYPKRSFLGKAIDKLGKAITHFYRKIRFKIVRSSLLN